VIFLKIRLVRVDLISNKIIIHNEVKSLKTKINTTQSK